MRSRRLCGLCLALLLAGLPSFLVRLWDQAVELLPVLAASEAPPPPAAQGSESTSGEGTPDLGLGMDPNG